MPQRVISLTSRGGLGFLPRIEGVGHTGKLELLGFIGALGAVIGAHSSGGAVEDGLVDTDNERLLRLVHNEHGPHDAQTGEGFPVWDVDFDGQSVRLTMAPFEDITLVRMARVETPSMVSMR